MDKPGKPYPAFPLYAHASGYWAKRINGRIFYFGAWRKGVTWKEAFDRYKSECDALHAGRDPANYYSDGLTVQELCNLFLAAKERLLETGDLVQRTFDDYFRSCRIVANFFGRKRSVESLRPDDFESLRVDLARTRRAVAMGNEINRIRSIFRYGHLTGSIATPVVIGPDFKRPGEVQIRKQQTGKAAKLFTAAEVNQLLEKATEPLRTMILLGINCAYGNADCGRLTESYIDLKRGWIRDYPRGKTWLVRTVKLWPETVKGLRRAINSKRRKGNGLIFVTRYGNSYFKESSGGDAISKEFRKLEDQIGCHKHDRGFYALRHTFETEAGGSLDQAAVDHIMGHKLQHISSNYRHGIHDRRLKSISEYVLNWLTGVQAGVQGKNRKPRKKRSTR